MNNSTQAQKGFKTFIATLIVSFVVFSAVYYLATEYSVEPSLNKTAETVMGAQTAVVEEKTPATDPDTLSPFADLVAQQPEVITGVVLAGADEVSETTTPPVPDTGAVEITVGLIFSVMVFGVGVFYLKTDARKKAIKSFEKTF